MNRVYTFSGLLKLSDGTKFHGDSAHGKYSESRVYYYKAKNVRVSADLLEEEARKTVTAIIKNHQKFQDAIIKRAMDIHTASELLDVQVSLL